MLIARGSIGIGASTMAWAVAFGPRLRFAIAHRRGLVLDTRFVPASTHEADDDPCLYVVLRGSWRDSEGSHFQAPAAFVVSEQQLEGAFGERPFTYRCDPHDFLVVEAHFRAGDTPLRAGVHPVPVVLEPGVWAALGQVAAIESHDDSSLIDALCTFADRLGETGLLAATLPQLVRRPASLPLRLLWTAIRPMAERLDLLPTLQQVGDSIGVSSRQVDRYVREFLVSSRLVGRAWRPASLHLRLKMAVVLLSAPEAKVGEVARIVGYGSIDAMGRAFRDAGLGSPSAVQEAHQHVLRGGDAT